MIQAFAAIICGFNVPASALVKYDGKAAITSFHMYPPIDAAKVEDLPWLQINWLSCEYTAHLNALLEPPQDAVCSRSVKNIWKIIRALPLQVVQMALTCGDLCRAAHIVVSAGNDLLGIDGCWMVQAVRKSTHLHRGQRLDKPQLRPLRASAQAGRGLAV